VSGGGCAHFPENFGTFSLKWCILARSVRLYETQRAARDTTTNTVVAAVLDYSRREQMQLNKYGMY